MATHVADRNQECTVWVGGLEPPATEELLYELMLQAGPVVTVNMPRDAVTQAHQVRWLFSSPPLCVVNRAHPPRGTGRRVPVTPWTTCWQRNAGAV